MGQNHRIMRTKKNKKQADNNRRLAQIYNRICEGYGDTYDEDTVRKVFKYVTNKNKIIMDEIDRKQSQSKISYSDEEWIEKLQSQVRDTLIFEQFDYLNEELSEEKEVWGAPEPDGDEEEIERIFG